jgi:hypothetical protein
VREVRPLGWRRLVDEVCAVDGTPLRGVGLFGPIGTVSATIAAGNPMWPTRDTRRKVAEVQARAAASTLPPIVALAVGTGTVSVYPTTTKGHLSGGMVEQWHADDFKARTYPALVVIRLTVLLRSYEHVALEAKISPIGPNRFHRRIARMIVDMGRLGVGAGE